MERVSICSNEDRHEDDDDDRDGRQHAQPQRADAQGAGETSTKSDHGPVIGSDRHTTHDLGDEVR